MAEEKIEFEQLPQELQARFVRKLIEEYEFSYGVTAYILVGDHHRRGLVAGLCRKFDIKASAHRPGFIHLRKGPGGVVLRLEEQDFPTFKALATEIEQDIAKEQAVEVEKEKPLMRYQPLSAKKYKPAPPGARRKLATLEVYQCEEIVDDTFRCGVEKAPGSRFCLWHQPLDE